MNKINYQAVSMAVIIRDIADLKPWHYLNDEHKDLVDIADFLYNANLGAEYLKPEAKALYDEYGKDYFREVLKDAAAIDSQLTGDGMHEQELLLDYQDVISGAVVLA